MRRQATNMGRRIDMIRNLANWLSVDIKGNVDEALKEAVNEIWGEPNGSLFERSQRTNAVEDSRVGGEDLPDERV